MPFSRRLRWHPDAFLSERGRPRRPAVESQFVIYSQGSEMKGLGRQDYMINRILFGIARLNISSIWNPANLVIVSLLQIRTKIAPTDYADDTDFLKKEICKSCNPVYPALSFQLSVLDYELYFYGWPARAPALRQKSVRVLSRAPTKGYRQSRRTQRILSENC
jgi:hypothetical protein